MNVRAPITTTRFLQLTVHFMSLLMIRQVSPTGPCLPVEWEGTYWLQYDQSTKGDLLLVLKNDLFSTTYSTTLQRYLRTSFLVLCCPNCTGNDWPSDWSDQPWLYYETHHRSILGSANDDCFKVTVYGNIMLLYSGTDNGIPDSTCENASFPSYPEILVRYPPVMPYSPVDKCGLPADGVYQVVYQSSSSDHLQCVDDLTSWANISGSSVMFNSCYRGPINYNYPLRLTALYCVGSYHQPSTGSMSYLYQSFDIIPGTPVFYCVVMGFTWNASIYYFSMDVTDPASIYCAPEQNGFSVTDASISLSKYIGFTLTAFICQVGTCRNGGFCRSSSDTVLQLEPCVCPYLYTGIYCESELQTCQSVVCFNGGTCLANNGTLTCECPTDYEGQLCENKITSRCGSFVCESNGTCTLDAVGPKCVCSPGYYGVNCEREYYECWSQPCKNAGTCLDYLNSFTCVCASGYGGTFCEQKVSSACLSSPCPVGRNCVNLVIGFQCLCASGYTGPQCSQVLTSSSSAVMLADRVTSSIITTTTPLTITAATFQMTTPLRTRVTTSARSSLQVSPTTATSTESCLNITCLNGGTCVQWLSSFSCACPPMFFGSQCELRSNSCDSIPCLSGGACRLSVSGYTCTCVEGFTGANCEQDVIPCDSGPCQNGAACLNRGLTFICVCNAYTTGLFCDTVFSSSSCDSQSCLNGGICVNDSCLCANGLDGDICEVAYFNYTDASDSDASALNIQSLQTQVSNRSNLAALIAVLAMACMVIGIAIVGYATLVNIQKKKRMKKLAEIERLKQEEATKTYVLSGRTMDIRRQAEEAVGVDTKLLSKTRLEQVPKQQVHGSKVAVFTTDSMGIVHKTFKPSDHKPGCIPCCTMYERKNVRRYNFIRTKDEQLNAELHKDHFQSQRN